MTEEDVAAERDALMCVIVAMTKRLEAAGIMTTADLISDLQGAARSEASDPQAESQRAKSLRLAIATLKLGRVPM